MKEHIVYRKEEVKSEAMKLLYSNLPKSIETSDADAMEIDGTEKWLHDFIEMLLYILPLARMKSRSAVTNRTLTLPEFQLNVYSEVSIPLDRLNVEK
jgi:hypothetical protein